MGRGRAGSGAGSTGTRAGTGGCFRPSRSTRSSSIGPSAAASCAHVFAEAERVDAAAPSRRQVAELPPIAVRVTEHRLHRVLLPGVRDGDSGRASRRCHGGRSGRGSRPPSSRSRSATASRAVTRPSSPGSCSGSSSRPGTVDAIVQRAGEALAAPHTRLEQQLKAASVVNIDETGWKTAGGTPDAVGRADQPDGGLPDRGRPPRLRGKDAARRALRRDRLLRPLARLRLPRSHPAAALLGAPAQRLHRPQRRHGRTASGSATTASRSHTTSSPPGTPTSQTATEPGSKPRPRRSKRSSARCSNTPPGRAPGPSTTASFAKNLLNRWPALWTFTHTDGVEPTNNHAERGLRGAVIYRKLSLGSQSEQGERTIERLLSASLTCRLQKRSLFAYLTDVLTRQHPRRPHPRARLTARGA